MTRRKFIHAAAAFPVGVATAQQSATATGRARDFLTGLFDKELDLLPEFRGSKTFWLYHDNYLAAAVLKQSHTAMSEAIAGAIRKHHVTGSGKIEIVLGEAKAPLPFRRYELVEVTRIGQKIIKTERVTAELLRDWERYADLLLMASLAEPELAKARAHFDAARNMWDGRGFADVVVIKTRQYATYKLALALRAAKLRGFDLPEAGAIRQQLLARQDLDGGFITDYSAEGKNLGVANVETTSLAVLAFEPTPPYDSK